VVDGIKTKIHSRGDSLKRYYIYSTSRMKNSRRAGSNNLLPAVEHPGLSYDVVPGTVTHAHVYQDHDLWQRHYVNAYYRNTWVQSNRLYDALHYNGNNLVAEMAANLL
jgi:hypothetical protein